MDILHSYPLSCLHYKSFLKPLQRFASITLNYVCVGGAGASGYMNLSAAVWGEQKTPGAGVTESCDSPEMSAGNSGPLGEQQLLTAELSPSPFESIFRSPRNDN